MGWEVRVQDGLREEPGSPPQERSRQAGKGVSGVLRGVPSRGEAKPRAQRGRGLLGHCSRLGWGSTIRCGQLQPHGHQQVPCPELGLFCVSVWNAQSLTESL